MSHSALIMARCLPFMECTDSEYEEYLKTLAVRGIYVNVLCFIACILHTLPVMFITYECYLILCLFYLFEAFSSMVYDHNIIDKSYL